MHYKRYNMKISALLFFTIFISGYSFAQDCKVLKLEIAKSYKGECKNGLAHGTGIAKGQDTYEGEFKKGFPEGTGTYTWANGDIYKGYMKKGLKEGKGSFIQHTVKGDSTLTGIWNKDKYEGSGNAPYQVGRTESVPRYSISKGIAARNKITFRFVRAGANFSNVNNLSASTTSGTDSLNGTLLEIQDAVFPVDIKLNFSVPNLLNTYEYNCVFNLTINQQGSWDVVLNI